MADEFLTIQNRVEAVKARLPQLMTGLDPRQSGQIRTPAPLFMPGPRVAEPPPDAQRAPLDPALPQAATLRRFSTNLPVAPPAVVEAPERAAGSEARSTRLRRGEVEDVGETSAPAPQPTRFPTAGPGAAYHVETSATAAISESGARGADPPSIERRHALVLLPTSPNLAQRDMGGRLWIVVLIGVSVAALLLLR